jgi:hypothetical protein
MGLASVLDGRNLAKGPRGATLQERIRQQEDELGFSHLGSWAECFAPPEPIASPPKLIASQMRGPIQVTLPFEGKQAFPQLFDEKIDRLEKRIAAWRGIPSHQMMMLDARITMMMLDAGITTLGEVRKRHGHWIMDQYSDDAIVTYEDSGPLGTWGATISNPEMIRTLVSRSLDGER